MGSWSERMISHTGTETRSRLLRDEGETLTVPRKKAPANSVPAAAVIQRVQALLGFTGRKAYADGEEGRM
jgi:hypothetical protein